MTFKLLIKQRKRREDRELVTVQCPTLQSSGLYPSLDILMVIDQIFTQYSEIAEDLISDDEEDKPIERFWGLVLETSPPIPDQQQVWDPV